MDDNYPTLKRSKKQLTYPSSKPSLLNKWTKDTITLKDVDQMFDDLAGPEDDDILSPSPVLHIPVKKRLAEGMDSPVALKRQKCEMAANGDHAPQSQFPKSPELDIDYEIPFKAHGPVKTSSPIEEMAAEHDQEEKEDNSTTPILFDVEEEHQDAERAEKPPKHRKDETDDSVFETLPSKLVLTKMSTQKKSQPICPPDASKSKSNGSSEKVTESAQNPSQTKHSMTAFLQKLRDAGQSKSACTEVSQAKITPPPSEPEPEDDFLILDDDVPFYISIPSKSAKSKGQQTKGFDKDPKDSTGDEQSVDKQQRPEPENKPDSQTVNEKLKKNTRHTVSKSHSSGSDNGKDPYVFPTPEPTNTETKIAQSKATKKKSQNKKLSSKDDNQPEDKDQGQETNNERPVKTAESKGSKSLKNNKEHVKKKMTLTLKERRKMEKETKAVTNTMEQERQECSADNSTNNEALGTENVNAIETEPTNDATDVKLKQNIPSSSVDGTSDDEVHGRRKRKPPGEWWMSSQQSSQQQVTAQRTTTKKSKTSNKDSSAAPTPVKTTTGARKKSIEPTSSSSSSSDRQRLQTKTKRVKKVKSTKTDRPATTKQTEEFDEVFAEPIVDRGLDRDSDSDSSPLLFQHRERSLSSGDKVFHKVYQNSSNERVTFTPEHTTSRMPDEHLSSGDSAKRRRRSPGNWGQVQEVASSQPQQPKPQKRKTAEKRKKSKDSQPIVPSISKPQEGAPKQKKRVLATYQDLFNTGSPPISKDRGTELKKLPLATFTSPAEVPVTEHNGASMETEELRSDQNDADSNENTLHTFRSGPCSMIQLENFEEENEDLALPSTTVQSVLNASDLCASPLKPLVLQSKDKDNLKDWLKILWSTKDKGAEITPDHFEWYFYQGRAMGFMVDIRSSAICSGKMLLGSFMKKPLWVDHSATTVFHLLTSSVTVIVDCKKSQYTAGQSFMVKSGHAYSVHNTSAQPAVLYFTRIYSDEQFDD